LTPLVGSYTVNAVPNIKDSRAIHAAMRHQCQKGVSMVSRLAMVGRKAILVICAAAVMTQTPITAKRSQECATIYTDVGYGGDSTSICGDTSFVGWDWNDAISSVRVPEGYVLVLYEHENFGGAVLTIYTDDPDLREYSGPGGDSTWNDAASSLRFYDIWP
jgi:hypothetical protein